jgi:hypothetical protein
MAPRRIEHIEMPRRSQRFHRLVARSRLLDELGQPREQAAARMHDLVHPVVGKIRHQNAFRRAVGQVVAKRRQRQRPDGRRPNHNSKSAPHGSHPDETHVPNHVFGQVKIRPRGADLLGKSRVRGPYNATAGIDQVLTHRCLPLPASPITP